MERFSDKIVVITGGSRRSDRIIMRGGLRQLAMNLPATSLARLWAHRSVIVACFVFSRKIGRTAF